MNISPAGRDYASHSPPTQILAASTGVHSTTATKCLFFLFLVKIRSLLYELPHISYKYVFINVYHILCFWGPPYGGHQCGGSISQNRTQWRRPQTAMPAPVDMLLHQCRKTDHKVSW